MLVGGTPTSDLPESPQFVCFSVSPLPGGCSSPTWMKSSAAYRDQHLPAANYGAPCGPTGADRAGSRHAAQVHDGFRSRTPGPSDANTAKDDSPR